MTHAFLTNRVRGKDVLVALSLVVAMAGVGAWHAYGSRFTARAEEAACVERGLRWYKGKKAYPTVPDTGRPTEAVVRDHCGRSVGSFNGPKDGMGMGQG